MSEFTAIELEKLPSPLIVEALDYEQIFQLILAEFRSRHPDYSSIVESDPAYKLLEVAAYREMLLRQRVNDAARGVMLAYATGADLDNLAALLGVERLVLDAGDPNAIPQPIPPTYESDSRLRIRTQLALESFTTAGSVGSYIYHALTASGDVKDVDVFSPRPGEVVLTVLSALSDGSPTTLLMNTVYEACNEERVRPLTDFVSVAEPEIIEYPVIATLYFYQGPDSEVVKAEAEKALQAYVTDHHRLGHNITLSGIYAALHQPGVQRVDLSTPADNIEIDHNQAAFCTGISVSNGGVDE